MKVRQLRSTLWMFTAIAAVLAVVGWRYAARDVDARSLPSLRGVSGARRLNADSLHAAASSVAEHDPFRVDHQPSSVAYRAELEGVAPPPPVPKPPKPRLMLAGIIGGPPWEALLVSVPGRDGSALVRRGDTLGGLRVRSIGRDTVIVQGVDTTWRLIVRQPWQ
jgi:hypothetical protein